MFRVVIEEDRFEDGKIAYHAFCPALKGCHTWGHSPEEALANIREAAELYVEDLIEAGDVRSICTSASSRSRFCY